MILINTHRERHTQTDGRTEKKEEKKRTKENDKALEDDDDDDDEYLFPAPRTL